VKLGIGAAVAAILFGTCLPAWAYRVLEKDGRPVPLAEDSIQFDIDASVPSYLDFATVLREVQAAAQVWNAQANTSCGIPRIEVSTEPALPAAAGDGRNTIGWIESSWDVTGVSHVATGFTDLSIRTASGTSSIDEADILLNGEDFDWTSTATELPSLVSISATVAHEMGHALGLDHPCEFLGDAAPLCTEPNSSFAVMYPGAIEGEPQITMDEQRGLCALYARACESDGAGCISEPGLDPESCQSDKDCDDAQHVCVAGTCERISQENGEVCSVDEDCASRRCHKEACREPCLADMTCASGLECNASSRTCGQGSLAFGSTCDEAKECVSGLCYVDPGPDAYCTRRCDMSATCPNGWTCAETKDDGSYCVMSSDTGGGCSLVSRRSSGLAGVFASLAALLGIGLWLFARICGREIVHLRVT
jgi:hypothetical protein